MHLRNILRYLNNASFSSNLNFLLNICSDTLPYKLIISKISFHKNYYYLCYLKFTLWNIFIKYLMQLHVIRILLPFNHANLIRKNFINEIAIISLPCTSYFEVTFITIRFINSMKTKKTFIGRRICKICKNY